jgi:c-di-GMP-binding flagellar brake protein YcgR
MRDFMGLLKFAERRFQTRHSVQWEGQLRCSFPDFEKTIPVAVNDISYGGAGLSLEGMQVGPYHLVVGDGMGLFELCIPKAEGMIIGSVEFRWFNFDDRKGLFIVGIEFVKMEGESKSILKEYFRRIRNSV